MEPTLAFNTVSSFTTNTNLQHYSGETGLSSLSQMFVITFLQFVTAATGVAAAVAIIRGLAGNRLRALGNFYVDLTRATIRLFLPLALLVSVILMWQGTPMTFDGAAKATTVEGQAQTIARGVAAGVVSIKQLGTNGGGYFGPNSSHPFENPTPLSGFVETWSITIVPMSLVVMLGLMVGRRKLAAVIFATMLAIYLPMVAFGVAQELGGNPAISALGVDQSTGSMEGKEVRFGAGLSALWAVTTTVTSNGSVNSMHDSMTPLGGLMPMVGMWLNNVFGGVGVGFINMLIFVIVAVFVAGMMIGRTPEFLGKKVEAREVKLASLALLWHPLAILVGTAVACYVWATTADPGSALAWLKNPGPHGFSEMLYEFSSAAANNGSGFEGLGDNTPFWNVSTGVVMLLSRYVPIIAPLALAGSLAAKPAAPETAGSLQADTATFGFTLWSVVLILGLLMFMPVAVLGPIAEHLALR
jgi:K+-transporting ATPase ATPase A chain